MKTARLMVFIVVPLLFSCLPKKPEIIGTEVPAGPLIQALEQQRRAFTALKAIASVEVVRQGKKRSFDTVGIVLDAQRRLRIEAFGPLGQSLIALIWDGKDVLVRRPDDDRIMSLGRAGLESILGISIEAKALCAALSGTITEVLQPQDARAYCVQEGDCVIELPEGDVVRRVHVLPVSYGLPAVRVVAQELYRADKPAYRVRYERTQEISHLLLPRTIIIESLEKNATLTIEYTEVDVNAPIAEDVFTLSDRGAEVK